MNKITIALLFLNICYGMSQETTKHITKYGQVSFFSYTSVENIEATNNQALSIIDLSNNNIAIRMLIRTFVFKKALMQEHFNESYMESDIYPEATFEGEILNFDTTVVGTTTKIIKGLLNVHGISKNVEIKTTINNTNGVYELFGDFEVDIKDYDIKVPPILAGNIAKTIKLTFSFKYEPYKKI